MSETIYGIHAVKAFVSNHPERLIEVLALKGRDDQRLQPLINEIQRLGISVQFLNRQTLDKKAEGEVHQGIIRNSKRAFIISFGWCDRST